MPPSAVSLDEAVAFSEPDSDSLLPVPLVASSPVTVSRPDLARPGDASIARGAAAASDPCPGGRRAAGDAAGAKSAAGGDEPAASEGPSPSARGACEGMPSSSTVVSRAQPAAADAP